MFNSRQEAINYVFSSHDAYADPNSCLDYSDMFDAFIWLYGRRPDVDDIRGGLWCHLVDAVRRMEEEYDG